MLVHGLQSKRRDHAIPPLHHRVDEPKEEKMLADDVKRRNELAYLALYYAITGNEERSEMIRRVVRRLEGQRVEATPDLVEA